jgi:hypothetical protein
LLGRIAVGAARPVFAVLAVARAEVQISSRMAGSSTAGQSSALLSDPVLI